MCTAPEECGKLKEAPLTRWGGGAKGVTVSLATGGRPACSRRPAPPRPRRVRSVGSVGPRAEPGGPLPPTQVRSHSVHPGSPLQEIIAALASALTERNAAQCQGGAVREPRAEPRRDDAKIVFFPLTVRSRGVGNSCRPQRGLAWPGPPQPAAARWPGGKGKKPVQTIMLTAINSAGLTVAEDYYYPVRWRWRRGRAEGPPRPARTVTTMPCRQPGVSSDSSSISSPSRRTRRSRG